MATKYLLTSEDFVKSQTNVSDNLSGKYLLGAIREAQDVALRGIIGSCLLETLEEQVEEGTLAGDYKELVDRAQYFLAYTALANVAMTCSYKLTNFGVAKSNDENLTVATMDEIIAQQGFYQAKADARCYELQTWIIENRDSFAELDDCTCNRMRAHLYASATSNVWLGGVRGKSVRPSCKAKLHK